MQTPIFISNIHFKYSFQIFSSNIHFKYSVQIQYSLRYSFQIVYVTFLAQDLEAERGAEKKRRDMAIKAGDAFCRPLLGGLPLGKQGVHDMLLIC